MVYQAIVATFDLPWLHALNSGQRRLYSERTMVKIGIAYTYIYSNIWDKALMDNEEFETKRSECVSQVTRALKEKNKDIKLQKLDFILRDLNNDADVVTVEEKPILKGVKADVKKGGLLKKHALYLWSKQVRSCFVRDNNVKTFTDHLYTHRSCLTRAYLPLQIADQQSDEEEAALQETERQSDEEDTGTDEEEVEEEECHRRPLPTPPPKKNQEHCSSHQGHQEGSGIEEEEAATSYSSLTLSVLSSSHNIPTYSTEAIHLWSNWTQCHVNARTMRKLKQLTPDEDDWKRFTDWEDMVMFDNTKLRKIND
ncbi:hypothetical protein MBANPS3_010841 [Mucor bainieri]